MGNCFTYLAAHITYAKCYECKNDITDENEKIKGEVNSNWEDFCSSICYETCKRNADRIYIPPMCHLYITTHRWKGPKGEYYDPKL